MLKFLCAAAIGVALVMAAGPAMAQQSGKGAKKCTPPRDICLQRCSQQGGRNCQAYCSSRSNTC